MTADWLEDRLRRDAAAWDAAPERATRHRLRRLPPRSTSRLVWSGVAVAAGIALCLLLMRSPPAPPTPRQAAWVDSAIAPLLREAEAFVADGEQLMTAVRDGLPRRTLAWLDETPAH